MKYLLDTHTYLWYRSSPRVLPSVILSLLTDMGQEMLISIVTPWELAIKTGIGKLNAAGLLVDFENRETSAGFVFTGITTTQAIRSGLLPLHHKDPFDRMLIAQADAENMPIVSNERSFDDWLVRRIW